MLNQLIYDGAKCKTPEVGDKATHIGWSDRNPYEVTAVERKGQVVVLRAMNATAQHRGMTDSGQNWMIESNPNGHTIRATRRKDGGYRKMGCSSRVLFGRAEKYHDYSF